jgi:hypothetical protein
MSEPTTTTSGSPDYSRSFFGHPRGLATLFMTEFFERFTYYGLRTMLVLFLAASTTAVNPGYGIDNETAGAVYALFAGCAYLVTVPGGWIADQLIGRRNRWSGNPDRHWQLRLHPSDSGDPLHRLAFTILGIGLLKPNVSSVVSALYEGQPEHGVTPVSRSSWASTWAPRSASSSRPDSARTSTGAWGSASAGWRCSSAWFSSS